jgi:hypothetical protein
MLAVKPVRRDLRVNPPRYRSKSGAMAYTNDRKSLSSFKECDNRTQCAIIAFGHGGHHLGTSGMVAASMRVSRLWGAAWHPLQTPSDTSGFQVRQNAECFKPERDA